jgi:hypothetical protein
MPYMFEKSIFALCGGALEALAPLISAPTFLRQSRDIQELAGAQAGVNRGQWG